MPREPSRYLLLKVLSDDKIVEETFRLSIMESILNLFGEAGLVEAKPRLVNYDEKAATAIVRCTRGSVEKLRASIALIYRIGETPTATYVTAVSGTTKGLKPKRASMSN